MSLCDRGGTLPFLPRNNTGTRTQSTRALLAQATTVEDSHMLGFFINQKKNKTNKQEINRGRVNWETAPESQNEALFLRDSLLLG